MSQSIFELIYACLMQPSASVKRDMIEDLYADLHQAKITNFNPTQIKRVLSPGRPDKPQLVSPREVNKRSFSSAEGRLIMMHSFAHIEFNAINLALDAAYRFQFMPQQFTLDWLKVAKEEAYHFSLIADYLESHGSYYGAYTAHNGLWDMVVKTDHDVLHRMGLVPRVMEARGLDVSPKMIERFLSFKDQEAAEIIAIIYRDEIGHVRIGNKWFEYCCAKNDVDPSLQFMDLLNHYFEGKLRGPFNWPARKEAGFSEKELEELEQFI